MIDLYGGAVEIFFRTAQGKTVSLADLFYGGSASRSKFQTAHFVSSVSVELSLLRFLQVSINLSPTFDKAVRLLQNKNSPIGLGFSGSFPSGESAKSTDLAAEAFSKFAFNTVSLRLHFGGKKSNFFKAVLLVPEINISADGITIHLKGAGMLFPQSQKSLNQSVQASSRLDLIKKLIPAGSTLVINEKDTALSSALSKIETAVISGSSYEEFKKLLIKSNCYAHEIGGSSPESPEAVEIISKSFMSARDGGGITFVLWGQINPNKGVYPILEMKTSIANYMAGQMIKQVTAYDSSKKQKSTDPSNPKTIPSKTNQKLATNDGSGVGVNLEGEEKIKKTHIPSRGSSFGTSMVESFEGIFNQLTDKALQYEITTVGIVDLRPGMSVNVKVAGVGLLSGKYDLYSVRHEMGSGGVYTHLTLARTFGFSKLVDNGVEALQQKIAPEKTAAPIGRNIKNSTGL